MCLPKIGKTSIYYKQLDNLGVNGRGTKKFKL